MSDIELSKYAKDIPHFRGVFMRDRLPIDGPRYNESGIINLDVSSGPGSHWVAYKKRAGKVLYYDSYGDLRPPPEVMSYLRNADKIYYNPIRYQRLPYNCGHLCLKFLNSTSKLKDV